MSPRLIVQLPYLHSSGCFEAFGFTGARILDPGHLIEDGQADVSRHERLFRPRGYPFASPAASALLREMRQMNLDGGSAWLAIENRGTILSDARLNLDLLDIVRQLDEDVDETVPAGDSCTDDPLERFQAEQAQKLLLMAWLQEERQIEMEALARRLADCAGRIAACLGNTSNEKGESFHTGPDDSILADWRLVVENALFFLPENIAVAALGPMRKALLESLEFAAWPEGGEQDILYCAAPLWQALGNSAPPQGDSSHARKGNARRLWLIRADD